MGPIPGQLNITGEKTPQVSCSNALQNGVDVYKGDQPLGARLLAHLREVRGIEAGAAWEVVERVQAREALHSFGRRAHRLRCLVNLVGAATGNEQRTTHFPYDLQSSGTSGCPLAIHIPASAKANSLIMRQ